jgi:hypothetical protein
MTRKPTGQRKNAVLESAWDLRVVERIEKKVMPIPECGCWIWMGRFQRQGYGLINYQSRARAVHRLLFEVTRGPVPDGLVLDHKCRVTSCCNPDHLEIVTGQENTLRGIGPTAINAKKTHCDRGHPLSGDNLRIRVAGWRVCRTCKRESQRLRRKMERRA